MPPEVLDDQRADHQPGAAADPEDRRHQPDAAGDPLRREFVAGDREREREDPAGDALDHTRDDQHRERLRDRSEQRAGREYQQRPQEQALLAVHVAEPADDRGANRRRHEEPGEQPGRAGLGRVQLVLERRQSRDHRRAQDCVRQTGQRQDRKDQVRMDALRFGRRPTHPPTVPNGARCFERPVDARARRAIRSRGSSLAR